jgi:phosphohistidine phosphatase
MYLYLIRHAIAIDRAPNPTDTTFDDESRPLTKIGRKKMAQVAKRLDEFGLNFDRIITSPLVRARQTADMLVESQLGAHLEVSPHLAPGGNIHQWLDDWTRSGNVRCSKIALVGHAPDLSEWAELFMFAKIVDRTILKKGGVIGLKFPAGNIALGTARLYCSIPPKFLFNRSLRS